MGMVNVRNLGFGGTGIPDALPQAIAELQGLRLTVVNGAAAGTVVPIPGMDPEDTIGAAVDLTGQVDINPSTITLAERNAKATITCLSTAVDGDKVTVNGKVYTIKDVVVHPSYNTPPGIIPIDITPSGTDAEVFAKRLANAIMSGDSKLTADVGFDAGSPPKRTVVTVKVRQPGTAGNAFTLSEVGNAVTVSGATFTGGTATGSTGFTSSVSLAGKKVLVLWYDKRPGQQTNPLLMELGSHMDEPPDVELRVEELEPDRANIGDPNFTLHVHGNGFGPDSVINFNGHDEPTTFVSTKELTTGVNMSVWHGPSEPLPVVVRTGLGDQSEALDFQFFAAGTPLQSPPESGRSGKGGGNLTFRGGEDEKHRGPDQKPGPGKPKIGR